MASQDTVYTLHYFPFSLYSIMARFGFEIAASLGPETSPKYQLKLVNLHEDEEVSEAYLTEVNSKGQVSLPQNCETEDQKKKRPCRC